MSWTHGAPVSLLHVAPTLFKLYPRAQAGSSTANVLLTLIDFNSAHPSKPISKPPSSWITY